MTFQYNYVDEKSTFQYIMCPRKCILNLYKKIAPAKMTENHLTGAIPIYSAFLIVANTPARTPAAAARAFAIWWA